MHDNLQMWPIVEDNFPKTGVPICKNDVKKNVCNTHELAPSSGG